ncbi:GyrI-like domain-containing protein [Mesorhizobium microcysteis]|uniref:GyrI-like domain-containing protein n=1 Tax=Neoaquamicrobium microcysteis TaxID=2682781 RepID=A0A5D4H8U8_9HYPH|nr:GyrI-like domain-containing protein [Mesorhizobium microcysteis]TYR35240.1 GyrI-like domain-containing protein [Mesorhizobium microcysteis]
MCQLCGSGSGSHAVSISERPPQLLGGLWWRGTFDEAAAGDVRQVIRSVQHFSDQRTSMWKSPIVGLSRNDRPDGFDYFVGVAVEAGEAMPAGFAFLDLPAMTVASSWHGPQDGDVPAHYGRMIEWLVGSGYRRDISQFHHREEYPSDVDFDGPHALRLLLPVMRDGAQAGEMPEPRAF